jgi:hypothetical protein
MNRSPLASASHIEWNKDSLKMLSKLKLEVGEVEEVLLNFPKVKRVTQEFSDNQQRYFVDGVTDLGKRIHLIMFINNQKIIVTYLKIL